MYTRLNLLILVAVALVLSACSDKDSVAPTSETDGKIPAADSTEVPMESRLPSWEADGILLSELLTGMPGENNQEFIELFNAGASPVDLRGYTLWHSDGSANELTLVHSWDYPELVAAYGHYLLVRSEKEFGLIPDAEFDLSLSGRKGGLILRDADDSVIDSLAWGDASNVGEGEPAGLPAAGSSLERLPGSGAGNGIDTGRNGTDFIASSSPAPQNSGSHPTPDVGPKLSIVMTAAESIDPGDVLELALLISNDGPEAVQDLTVIIPFPQEFAIAELPADASSEEGEITWTGVAIEAGASAEATLTLVAPYSYLDWTVNGVRVVTQDGAANFGPVLAVAVEGGAIPIAKAREYVGATVAVEGIATMYTGGLFAGTTGTKFYVEDDTGGIQIFVPTGLGALNVEIGELVRVSGATELYRDSLELIPGDFQVDVIKQGAVDSLPPNEITVGEFNSSDGYFGQLVVVEGTLTRIEEFSYSFEVDVTDDEGNTLLAYIDKLTSISEEPLELGSRYRVSGIAELYSGNRLLYPRIQDDFTQVFPPELMVSLRAPSSIEAGDQIGYEITAINYTHDVLEDISISVQLPLGEATFTSASEGYELEGNRLTWGADSLEPLGGSATLQFELSTEGTSSDRVTLAPVEVTAAGYESTVLTQQYITFLGSGVPIWAIQGPGDVSPYVRSEATTVGIVTGVFPELQGFWIQETESDDDPDSSAGLFVYMDEKEIPFTVGDEVTVNGRIREISGQTALHVALSDNAQLLGSGRALPGAVSYDPPEDPEASLAYNEAIEGQLVSIAEPALVVAATTKYGEFGLVLESWGVDRVKRTAVPGYLIFGDDGSSMTHENQSTMPFALNNGDTVVDLTGPLAYTFGNFKIEPVSVPEIIRSQQELTVLPASGPSEFSVATFNVENLFDLLDPHPSSPPRPSLNEYRTKLAKLANAIAAMGLPDIVALQEVENMRVIEALAEQDALAAEGYVAYLIEGTDSRGIDVGYLVRPGRVIVTDLSAYVAPEGLTNRPPLVLSAKLTFKGSERSLYLLNNHFTSLAGGEEATEPRRTAQAAWNVSVIDEIRKSDPDGLFIVLGDLNSFVATSPILTLEEAGLRHAGDFAGIDEGSYYTYIYQGATQSLDHILASDELFGSIKWVATPHYSTDYALTLPDDTSPRRATDHDPLVVTFHID